MIKKMHIGILALMLGSGLSGCVSTGEFDKMKTGKNEEISTLQQQKTALEQQKAELEQQKSTLEQQKTLLERDYNDLKELHSSNEVKNSTMQQQLGSLEQQLGLLEQQKTALLSASLQRKQQYENLVQRLSKEVENGQLQVKQYQNMLSVDLAEQIFFDSGRATLKPAGKDVLKKVGEALKGYENKVIRVVGYTDNVKIAKSLRNIFPSNWELSVARATTVVRFLQDAGIPPERLVASGRGEYNPIAPNDTAEGRQKNRRIEIMLLDQNLVNEMEKSGN